VPDPQLDQYRALWRQADDASKALGFDRHPVLTPAAAAQEPMNRSRIWRQWAKTWVPWQFGDWIEEAMAVHETAFIGDWSALSKVHVKGPAARDFLHRIGVADLTKFSVGRIRHFVCSDENGKVATEGVLGRLSEGEYLYTGGGGEWLLYQFGLGKWDCEVVLVSADLFMFEVQGPRSFAALEFVCERSIQALPFNHWMPNKIGGAPVRVLRTGVSGELGYEVHGSSEQAAHVWTTIVAGGAPFGLKPLGHRSQVLAHVEAGIATVGFDYLPALINAPIKAQTSVVGGGQKILGTHKFARLEELFRSPFELNWCSRRVVQQQDFIGSDALRREIDDGGPHRRLCGLVWNAQDVVAIYASLFDDGEIGYQMELPRLYAAEYLNVLAGGGVCGVASSRVYSPKLRRMVSLAVLDREIVKAGGEVVVLWGTGQGREVEIRATIAELPFKPDRRRSSPASA
jgi:vanillate/3-O-methylgallate O-demethylase